MIRASFIIATLLSICASSGDLLSRRATTVEAGVQSGFRVAVIGFTGAPSAGETSTEDARLRPADAIVGMLRRDSRVSLIDKSLIKAALAGLGYDGSINMSKDEARRVGAAVGCDFFITGKVEALARSERKDELHEEAYAGVIIADGRTGALALFDFVVEIADRRESALNQLAKAVESRAAIYIERMIEYRARQAIIDNSMNEEIEDLPSEGSAQAAGFAAPEFLNRIKPEYTVEAERANISATVEARAVFRANGEVGQVELIRWAGFGLDESAERAIRQLKFKPATRNGKPASVRAIVQYNFRRKS